MDEQEGDRSVERLASGMAQLEGIAWQRRCPPHLRGRLREDARALLRTLDALDENGSRGGDTSDRGRAD